MRAFIKPHLYATRVGEHLIVLNLRTGAYDCILGAGASVAIKQGGELISEDAALMTQLCQPAHYDAPGRFRRSPPLRPSAGVVEPDWSAGRRWRNEVTWIAALMALSGRVRRFEGLLTEGRRAGVPLPHDEGAAQEITRGFLAGLPASPFQGECLFRSRVLLGLLRERG